MATAKNSSSHPLVIVESPNKVKTISKILGDGYTVRASYGHFADIPATNKGVDIAHGFAAEYSLTVKGKEIMAGLRKDMASASEVILATDDDREGEMIAALLLQFLKPTVPVSRIVFHSISAKEVLASLENRRDVNQHLVEAARTRRVLDHLVGFQVSPVLWSKVRGGLGAGRVQSPALRLVVEREYARLAFIETTYCGVEAELEMEASVTAILRSLNGVPVAASKDIDDAGVVAPPAELLLRERANAVVTGLVGKSLIVTDVKREKYTRKPRRPYITSDLLQDIVSRLHIGSKFAQDIMNQLHEKGLISYPRTDSPSLAPWIIDAAREQAVAMFGPYSVPEKPRHYFAKRKSAQEAHEAIRPADMAKRTPSGLTPHQASVYDMVWRRTVASQMVDATGTTVTVTLEAGTSDAAELCVFSAAGTTIIEQGHRHLYIGRDEEEPTPLTDFTVGDQIGVKSLEIKEHTTRPPARFTEASLIRALEEHEIGRPSTYASAMESLRTEYLWSKKGDQALIPTLTGVAVEKFLGECFPTLVDFEFTKQMEERLNKIVDGEESFGGVLETFFINGDGAWPSLSSTITKAQSEYDPSIHSIRIIGQHPDTGSDIMLKPGRTYGSRKKTTSAQSKSRSRSKQSTGSPYIKCDDRNVAVPDQTELSALTVEFALSLLDAPKAEPRVLGQYEGDEVVLKTGPYGPYIARGKRNVSLPPDILFETATLEDIAILLQFPRVIGIDPADGIEVVAKLGRYGAFVDKSGNFRSLSSVEQAVTITVDEALALLATEKKTRRKK
jgi:DNA topoisomerase-1